MTRSCVILHFILGCACCPNGLFAQENESRSDTLVPSNELPERESVLPDRKRTQSSTIGSYSEAYYILSTAPREHPPEVNLETPQASLENFMVNARNGRFLEASYSLDLKLLPEDLTRAEIVLLSKKLFYVINQRIYIDWGELPDRPDGQIGMTTKANQALAGKPRKSVLFGNVDLKDRDHSFRMDRVKSENTAPIWLISANTVENIEPLYAKYGPRKFDRWIPEWSKIKILKISVYKILLILLFLLFSYFLYRVALRIFKLISDTSRKVWIERMCERLAGPTSFALGVLVFYLLLNSTISYNAPFARYLNIALLTTVIIAFTWLISRVLDSIMLHYAEQKLADTSQEKNEGSRKLMTYISVARRAVTFIVVVVGIIIILSQFRSFQKLGISLLASAGVATVLLGIAGQSTLGNIIAGIQIAITKPARIGDTVIMRDQWGFVEDIGFTYMIVRTWDERRLVVPLKMVISETFENWSLKNPAQIKPIDFYVDYRMDVDRLRNKFKELLEASELWDREQAPSVQVIAVTEKSIKIRALCSAKDSYAAWDLHCALMESLIEYVGSLDNGAYLAKSRLVVHDDSARLG